MRALKDAGWASMALGANRALGFASLVVLARVLAIDDFATYLVVVAVSTILVPATDAGMWPLVTRLASRQPEASRFSFTGEADRARAPVWIFAIAVSVAGLAGGLWPNAELYVLAVIAAIGQAEMDTLSGELFGRRRFAAASALRVAPGLVGLLGAIVLLLFGGTVTAATAIFALSRVLPAAMVRPFVPLRVGKRSVFLRQGVAFGLTGGLMVLYVNSDLVLLSAFGVAASGIAVYGVAYRALIALQVIPAAVAMALYPRAAAASTDVTIPSLTRIAAGVSVCASTAILAVLFLNLELVFAIFGPSYADDVSGVRALLLVLIPIAVSQTYLSALQARDRENRALILVGMVAGVNLAGNVALIPVYGTDGALLATTGAEWLFAFATLAASSQLHGDRFRDSLLLVGISVPIALALLATPGWMVSVALIAWLVLAWTMDGFALRTRGPDLVRGLRGRSIAGATKDAPAAEHEAHLPVADARAAPQRNISG